MAAPGAAAAGADLQALLAVLAQLQADGGAAQGAQLPSAGSGAHPAFGAFQPPPRPAAPPTSSAAQQGRSLESLLQALEFWSQLFQIAHSGLANVLQQAQALLPPGLLSALTTPGAGPMMATTALQLLQATQSQNVPQAPLSAPSDVSAATAAAAAAAAGLPSPLLAGLLAAQGQGGLPAPGASLAALRREPSLDAAASDASHGQQRKRPREEGSGGGGTSSGKICSNCHTSNTPFWRKDRHSGLPLCNACGLYAAKNDHPRPVKLWREGQSTSPTQVQQQAPLLTALPHQQQPPQQQHALPPPAPRPPPQQKPPQQQQQHAMPPPPAQLPQQQHQQQQQQRQLQQLQQGTGAGAAAAIQALLEHAAAAQQQQPVQAQRPQAIRAGSASPPQPPAPHQAQQQVAAAKPERQPSDSPPPAGQQTVSGSTHQAHEQTLQTLQTFHEAAAALLAASLQAAQ